MTARFVPSEEPLRAVEALLRPLDPFLRTLAGPQATLTPHARGLPGRSVELARPDGVTVSLTICPLMLETPEGVPSQFLIALHGWTERNGRRVTWRNGPEWTVCLGSEETHAQPVRGALERAWRLALALDAAELLRNEGTAPLTGED